MKLEKSLVGVEKLGALHAEELEAGQNHDWLCLNSVCFFIVPHSGDSKYEFQASSSLPVVSLQISVSGLPEKAKLLPVHLLSFWLCV